MLRGELVERIDRYIETQERELEAFCAELIEVNSQIPPDGDERAVAELFTERFESFGWPAPEELYATPQRPNLVLTIGGSGGGGNLLLCGHMDTKPVGSAWEEWETDPLVPEVINGDLVGLGSADMKAACAAMIFASRAVLEFCDLAGDLTIALLADEENGSAKGARFVAPYIANRASAGLIGEPSGVFTDFDEIHSVSRGLLAFRVVVYGDQKHSGLSDRTPTRNAVVDMARLIQSLSKWTDWTIPENGLPNRGVTLNVGAKLAGGENYGVTPGYAWFGCDLRVPTGVDSNTLMADLNRWLTLETAKDKGLRAEVRLDPDLEWIPASEISSDHLLMKVTMDAAKSILDHTPEVGVFPGGTDAPWFDREGLPCVASCGPGLLARCHGPNEKVSLKAVQQATKMYARIILDYCDTYTDA